MKPEDKTNDPAIEAATPRTDAMLNGRLQCSGLEGELIDFARQLERELADLRAKLEAAEVEVNRLKTNAAGECERANCLGAKLETLRALLATAREVMAKKDEALRALLKIVRSVPALQMKQYDGVGIQVNAALALTLPAGEPEQPKPPTKTRQQLWQEHVDACRGESFASSQACGTYAGPVPDDFMPDQRPIPISEREPVVTVSKKFPPFLVSAQPAAPTVRPKENKQ